MVGGHTGNYYKVRREKINLMQLNLLVIKTGAMESLVAFYSILGLHFECHRHGNSPMHYAAKAGILTFEIYPLTKIQNEADNSLRLGFNLDDFDETISLLKANGIKFLSEPAGSEFGFSAVVQDPDGRKVELYKTI